MNSATGDLGTLTSEEERKLQQAWAHILCLLDAEHLEKESGAWGEVPDRRKELQQHLKSIPEAELRDSLWKAVLMDHPDALLLRFLRARKWDVEKAVEMLLSSMNWRHEIKIEEQVIRTGESVALKESLTEDEEGFIRQYRSGKSYVRGADKQQRPVYVVKAKMHDPSKQTAKAMEKYILHNIESIRLLVKHPNDKACLFFDMDGFGLKNMDFDASRFIVQVFEARYPETLAAVIIHNAPFAFWGIWKIVKGWLDPVVASKITFTRNISDLEELIDKSNLQTCYGGTDKWEYTYIEPSHDDTKRLEHDEDKATVQNDHDTLAGEFESHTVEWLAHKPGSPEATEASAKRDEVAEKLRESYWRLDPYLRTATYYHRAGVIQDKGVIDFQGAGSVGKS